MPRPTTLPLIDWCAVFSSGLEYTSWLEGAESSEQREKMETFRLALRLEASDVAALAGISRPVRVVAIAEDWCGDVVRHVPVLQRLAEATPSLEVRYISRQQWPDVFARFLTNGGEAIPKFIFLNENFVECGNWGPMPEGCRELIARGKACSDVGAARKKVAARYAADEMRREVVIELLHQIGIASATEP